MKKNRGRWPCLHPTEKGVLRNEIVQGHERATGARPDQFTGRGGVSAFRAPCLGSRPKGSLPFRGVAQG